MNERDIEIEAKAAAMLLGAISDVIADDDVARIDAIEGETNLLEAIAAADLEILDAEAQAEGLTGVISQLTARKKRLKEKADRLRTAIAVALETVNIPKVDLPQATLSMKKPAPALQIVDESEIPTKYLNRPPPVPDKRAILAALKNSEQVPGCTLKNGAPTLQIRRS